MVSRFHRFFALVAVLVVLSPAFCGDTGNDPYEGRALTAEEILTPRDFWYGVYGPDGKKIGFAEVAIRKEGDGEAAAYVTRMDCNLQLAAMGKSVEMEIVEEASYKAQAPFPLIRKSFSIRQGEVEAQRFTVDATGPRYAVAIKQMGQERTMEVANIGLTLADDLSIEVWLRRAARKVGDRCSSKTLSQKSFKAVQHTYTVAGVTRALVEGVEVTCYEVNCSDEEAGDMGVARADHTGRLLSMKIGGMFELRMEPEEQAKKIEAGSDLFVFGMTKADKPLGDPRKVTGCVLEIAGRNVDRLENAPNQTVSLDAQQGRCTVKLGTASTGKIKVVEKERTESLEETFDYPTKAPEVVALAGKAIGDAANDREKVARLVKFVHAYMTSELCPQPVPVLDIIKTKRGDCTEHSLLFTTLARAAGIPARGVTGLMYMGDGAKAFGGHAWNEVVLDGCWVEVDPTWNQLTVDGTHIRFGSDIKGLSATLACLGQLEVKVISVEHAP